MVTLSGFFPNEKGFGRNGAVIRAYLLGTSTVASTTTTLNHASAEPGYWELADLADGEYRVDAEWEGRRWVYYPESRQFVRLVVGSAGDYTQFDATGHQTMSGAAKPWDDVRVEPVERLTGANTPTFEKWLDDQAGTSRGVYLYSFDDAAVALEKELHFTMQMPHSWDGGPIHFHVHWVASHADTAARPYWGLEYAWQEIGAVFGDTTTVYSSVQVPDEADIVQFKHYKSEFAPLTPGSTSDGLSTILVGRLFRNSSSANDTYDVAGNKCGLLYIDGHFQLNSLGSTDEYSK